MIQPVLDVLGCGAGVDAVGFGASVSGGTSAVSALTILSTP